MNYPVHCQFSRSLRDDENDENDTAETCPWCGAMGKLRCGNLYELVNEVRNWPALTGLNGIGNGKIMGLCRLYGFVCIYMDLSPTVWGYIGTPTTVMVFVAPSLPPFLNMKGEKWC